MKVFGLLAKKFQPNYRMGKMYEDLSQKYEAYQRIYNMYCRNMCAGRTTEPVEGTPRYDLEKTRYTQYTMSRTDE
jgi:hypothetical protein